MKYIVHMIGGTRFTINEAEYKAIVGQSGGIVALPSLGITLNVERIETIYPESKADEIEDRKNQQSGILHDGTRAICHFGRWVDSSFGVNEFGASEQVNIDPAYYPEVGLDCVPTEDEYEKKYKHIANKEERLKAILGKNYDRAKRIGSPSSLSSMKDLMKKRVIH